jgi:hypothetical protein
VFYPRKTKVFCIGRNKTGTTSLKVALKTLGFKIGDQTQGELLLEDWARYDFSRIVELCRTADAFQDIPFSLDLTYSVLDSAFPGSKFILTIRDSADVWYESLTRYHSNLLRKGRLPTADDLKWCKYRKRGWLWREEKLVYGIDESTLYNRELYIQHYETHNRRVMDYFRSRPEDLLVLNLCESNAMKSLGDFIGVDCDGISMPHLNRSRSAASR